MKIKQFVRGVAFFSPSTGRNDQEMLSGEAFGRRFPVLNQYDDHDFSAWLFEPGMAYGHGEFWWPSARKKRPRAHEGMDFFCYEDSMGQGHSLAHCLVPVPCAGRVIAVCPDFLGQSVFLLLDQQTGPAGIYVLAHISPHVHPGQRVAEGDVAGRVAAARGVVPAHLHVSFLQGDWRDLPVDLSWPALLDQQKLRFSRPFF